MVILVPIWKLQALSICDLHTAVKQVSVVYTRGVEVISAHQQPPPHGCTCIIFVNTNTYIRSDRMTRIVNDESVYIRVGGGGGGGAAQL